MRQAWRMRGSGVFGAALNCLSGVESLGLPALGAIFVSELIAVAFGLGGAAGLRVGTVIVNSVEALWVCGRR